MIIISFSFWMKCQKETGVYEDPAADARVQDVYAENPRHGNAQEGL